MAESYEILMTFDDKCNMVSARYIFLHKVKLTSCWLRKQCRVDLVEEEQCIRLDTLKLRILKHCHRDILVNESPISMYPT